MTVKVAIIFDTTHLLEFGKNFVFVTLDGLLLGTGSAMRLPIYQSPYLHIRMPTNTHDGSGVFSDDSQVTLFAL